MARDQRAVFASIAPSVLEDYNGVREENWNGASNAISTAESSHSPSVKYTSIEQYVSVMPALPSRGTTPEAAKMKSSPFFVRSSGIPVVSPSVAPVSVVDLVENLLESYFHHLRNPVSLSDLCICPSPQILPPLTSRNYPYP